MLATPKNLQVEYIDTQLKFLLFHDRDVPTFVMYQNNGARGTSLIFSATVQTPELLSKDARDRVEPIGAQWAKYTDENPQRRLMHIEVDLYADELDYEARVLQFLREKFPNENFYARYIELIRFPVNRIASLCDQASANCWNNDLGPVDKAIVAKRAQFVNRLQQYQANTNQQYLYMLVTQRPFTQPLVVRPEFNSLTPLDEYENDYAALRFNLNNMNTYLTYLRTLRDFLAVAVKLQTVSLSYGGFFPLVIRYKPMEKSGQLVTVPDLRRGNRPARETYAELNRDGCNTVFLRNWRRACIFNVKEYVEQRHFLKYCGTTGAKNTDGYEIMFLFAQYQRLSIAKPIVANMPSNLNDAVNLEKVGLENMQLSFYYDFYYKGVEGKIKNLEETMLEQQKRREQREAMSSTHLLTPTKYFSGLRKSNQ